MTPLLDIYHITFILYAILSASQALEKRKPQYLCITYLCFVAAMMIKVWVIGVVFIIPVTVYILVKKWQYYPYVIAGFAITFCMTLLVYARLFYDKYTIIQILKVQKWLYWYQAGKINRFFTIWPLIFLNRWYVWWGETPISKDLNWSISWPISIGTGLVASMWALLKFRKKNMVPAQLGSISVVCYSIFMSLGQASARYLLPILPLCYALGSWILYTIIKTCLKKAKIL